MESGSVKSMTLPYLFLLLLSHKCLYSSYSAVKEHCASLYNYTANPGYETPIKVKNIALIHTHDGVSAYRLVASMVAQYTCVLLFLLAFGKDWRGTTSAEGCACACGSTVYLDSNLDFGSGLVGETIVARG
jgi:hypothetical protein